MTDQKNKNQTDTSIQTPNDKKLILDYAARINNFQTPDKKVSEVNLNDCNELVSHALSGNQKEQDIIELSMKYNTIQKKLTGLTKTHLNHMNTDFRTKKHIDGIGDLKFNKPSFWLKKLEGGDVEYTTSVTPTDEALAYKFIMFRMINGSNAKQIEPEYAINFKETDKSSYTPHDILERFEYITDNGIELAHSTNEDGKKEANKKAIKLVANAKNELKDIVKNTFSTYFEECLSLKNSTEQDMQIVCHNSTDFSNPDYTIEMHTCMETFTMAKDNILCSKPEYVDEVIDFN